MRRILISLTTLALILTAISPVLAADSALDDYNFAVGLYKMSRWSQAADAFRTYLTKHPDDAKAAYGRLYLGFTLVQLADYKAARDVLRDYVTRYPQSLNLLDAMYRVAECSYFLDDLPVAETEFKAFLAKGPDHSLAEWALPYLGDVQLRRGEVEAAIATFEKSLRQYPKGALVEEARFGLAEAYDASGQSDKSLPIYTELAANRAGTRAPQAQLKLAARQFDSGNFAEAAKSYLALERQFPESELVPLAHLNAGFAYYELDDFESALAEFGKAMEEPSQAFLARYWMGLCHKSRSDYSAAIQQLKSTYEANPDDDSASDVLFQWADCELRAEHFATAKDLFLQFVSRFPQHESADDGLHLAGECVLQQIARSTKQDGIADLLGEAESLMERFAREYPRSGLLVSQSLLRGRLLDAQGRSLELQDKTDAAKTKYLAARQLFQQVMTASQIERTRAQARFQLARSYERTQEHAKAVETLQPLVEQVRATGSDSEFADSLVLYGDALLSEKQYEAAREAMADYLRMRPNGIQREQALAAAVLASAKLNDKQAVTDYLTQLRTAFPESELAMEATRQAAEAAYSRQDWDGATELFEALASFGNDSSYHAAALSGLGWSRYQNKQYKAAAEAFSRLVAEHPDDELAAESAFKVGDCCQQAGDLEAATVAFSHAFRTFSSSEFGYLAGLQLARILRKQGKVDDADQAYDAVLKQFPKPDQLDKLLDEWALLHYEAGAYDRADALFRRLVQEVPESDLADNARYSLAESSLLNGELDDAKAAFQKLVDDPRSDSTVKQDALFRLVGIASEKEDWAGVKNLAAQLIAEFPESQHRWEVSFLLSDAQLQTGQLKEAKETLTGLQQKKDDAAVGRARWFPHVWIRLAEVCVRLKQYDAVIDVVEQFRVWDADCQYLYRADEILGRAYKNQAKFDLARQAFSRVIASKQGAKTATAAKSQLLLAETYYLQKDYEKAESEYLRVHVLYQFPEWQAPALFQAGLCDEQLKRWDSAAKTYENLLQAFPNSEYAEKARSRLDNARRNAAS